MQLPGSLIYACAYQFLAGGLVLFLVSNEWKYQCRIFFLSIQMSMISVLASLSLFFITTMVVHSRGDKAPHVLFQKLEDALKTNKPALYLLRKTFFPSQHLPRDLVNLHVHVTVDSVLSNKCDEHCPASGAISNFSYTQMFQWSSSPILDLIPSGQLLTLDNVLSRTVYRLTFHHSSLPVELQIDSFPIDATEKDLLEALIQLLCWVSTFICIKRYCVNNLYYTLLSQSYYIAMMV